ncbi:hypothetical protein GQ42DRAFT_140847 [Ramicandelaber brevisporus]|nr:hypothetical protein GQ42DRAFT_140847 [Ramicandelaber brevisporus]
MLLKVTRCCQAAVQSSRSLLVLTCARRRLPSMVQLSVRSRIVSCLASSLTLLVARVLMWLSQWASLLASPMLPLLTTGTLPLVFYSTCCRLLTKVLAMARTMRARLLDTWTVTMLAMLTRASLLADLHLC